LGSNAEKDGIITLTLLFLKGSGCFMSSGFYIWHILHTEIDGRILPKCSQVEQTILLKIIGIPPCKKEKDNFMLTLKVQFFPM
jgi:hypothetical protein